MKGYVCQVVLLLCYTNRIAYSTLTALLRVQSYYPRAPWFYGAVFYTASIQIPHNSMVLCFIKPVSKDPIVLWCSLFQTEGREGSSWPWFRMADAVPGPSRRSEYYMHEEGKEWCQRLLRPCRFSASSLRRVASDIPACLKCAGCQTPSADSLFLCRLIEMCWAPKCDACDTNSLWHYLKTKCSPLSLCYSPHKYFVMYWDRQTDRQVTGRNQTPVQLVESQHWHFEYHI
jgi:hypothetical protein